MGLSAKVEDLLATIGQDDARGVSRDVLRAHTSAVEVDVPLPSPSGDTIQILELGDGPTPLGEVVRKDLGVDVTVGLRAEIEEQDHRGIGKTTRPPLPESRRGCNGPARMGAPPGDSTTSAGLDLIVALGLGQEVAGVVLPACPGEAAPQAGHAKRPKCSPSRPVEAAVRRDTIEDPGAL